MCAITEFGTVESEPFVHRQIIGRPREQARHLRDLANIFIDVRLKQKPWMLAQQRLAHLQHRFGSGQREARSDRVGQTPVPMEALDQQAALAISALRRLMQFRTQQPVGEHLARRDRAALRFGGFKQRSGRGSKMRAKHQRRGGSMRSQRVHEPAGHAAGVGMIRHARLFGQRAMLQPIQQRPAQSAEHAQLRKMRVRVDEAGQKKAAAQIHGRNTRMRVAKTRIIAARGHAAIADQQTAVGVAFQRVRFPKWIARRMKQGRAQQFAPWRGVHRVAPTELTGDSRSARARSTAKNTRSGVAGLASITGPPAPNAAIASRMASRTEIASISGGSPTALLPKIVPGSGARSRKLTSKTSGTSLHDGSL